MSHDPCSLILLDVRMPGLDGLATAALLRQTELTRHIPIIFISAIHADRDHVAAGLAAGAEDYIVKPFDPELFRLKVANVIAHSRYAESLRANVDRQAALLGQADEDQRRRLRIARAQFHDLLMRAPMPLFITKGRNHRLVLVNPACRRLFGERTLRGKPARECLPELAGQGLFEVLDRAYGGSERYSGKSVILSIRHPGQDRHLSILDWYCTPWLDERGEIHGACVSQPSQATRILGLISGPYRPGPGSSQAA
jgi:CheY-like chemotaxis protein